MNFETWLLHIGKSQRSARSYATAITGVMSDWANEAGLVSGSLFEIQDYKTLQKISLSLASLDIFIQRNTKGNGMYSAALRQYEEYLRDISTEDLAEDLELIVQDETIATTEKSTFINARVGQGKFRKGLIDMWQGCAVTGFTDTRFLVASHIKPWKASNNKERLDPYNGLLLLPNLDKVFDLGYISFKESGDILIHKELEEYELLGVNPHLSVKLDDQHQDNMAYHRNEVFKN